jgi:hypothetical protein
MGTVAQLLAVTVDCPEPLEPANFYQAFAGGEVCPAGDDFVMLTGSGVRIVFQRAANPTSGSARPRRSPQDPSRLPRR